MNRPGGWKTRSGLQERDPGPGAAEAAWGGPRGWGLSLLCPQRTPTLAPGSAEAPLSGLAP